MSQTKVVHCQRDRYDIYIGRRHNNHRHYGNPFTHLVGDTLAKVQVASREYAIQAFREWLSGTNWTDIEPNRREWILANLKELKGKTLGCWCKPLDCHGDVLKELADANN
jgi:hypothetical protein